VLRAALSSKPLSSQPLVKKKNKKQKKTIKNACYPAKIKDSKKQ
jgi:hypothetical protein